LVDPYEDYVERFNEGVKALLSIAPTVGSVNKRKDEEEVLKIVQAFRDLMRLINVLTSFFEFNFADLYLTAQQYEDYQSKYLDIYDSTRTGSDDPALTAPIIEDVDFELERIHRDEINVAYILRLLAKLHAESGSKEKNTREESDKMKRSIEDLLDSETPIRSKRELIQRFIDQNMPTLGKDADVVATFHDFGTNEKRQAFEQLGKDEHRRPEDIGRVIVSLFLCFGEREGACLADGNRRSGQQNWRLGARHWSGLVR